MTINPIFTYLIANFTFFNHTMKCFSFFSYVLFMVIGLLPTSLHAQKSPMKFGKVDLADLNMTVYAKDSSASAVVLGDYGTSTMDYGPNGFQLVFERHRRIKILTKEGYDWADAEVSVYHEGSSKEKVSNIKGYTYNLEGGKVVKAKLDKKAIFEEKETDNWDAIKWTMPNVKEGSVIEYTYTIFSDFWVNYQPWEFQSLIPTVWSEYNARQIEYFQYKMLSQGYVPFDVNDRKESVQQFVIPGSDGGSVTAKSTSYRWVAKEVPAFKEEPFMTTPVDYISKISFELGSVNFPNQPPRVIMGTWAKFNEQFLKREDFGLLVKQSGFLKKQVETVLAGETDPKAKTAKLYYFMKNHMTWNGGYAKYGYGLKKAFDDKKGNSAQINLMLVSMLQKAGLNASPVLISTRNHGFIREQYPMAKQFNYVIASVEIEGKTLLMDATDDTVPLGMLPERCINGRGYRISTAFPGWLNLRPYGKSSSTIMANLDLSDDGSMSGTVDYSFDGYRACRARKKYLKAGEAEYTKQMKENSDWDISSVAFENQKEITAAYKEKHEVSIDDAAETMGNIIYINPVLEDKIEENPFKSEKREYPVDYTCPQKYLYMARINIPEGFKVDELPESKIVALPQNGGKFIYNVNVLGNTISVTSSLTINKGLFVQDEYPYLREFYAQIVEKQAEQIVLKKSQ